MTDTMTASGCACELCVLSRANRHQAEIITGLTAKLRQTEQHAATWELAALAGLVTSLDAKTAAQVGDRMRVIVYGTPERP